MPPILWNSYNKNKIPSKKDNIFVKKTRFSMFWIINLNHNKQKNFFFKFMLQKRGETEHPLNNDKFNTQKFSFIEKYCTSLLPFYILAYVVQSKICIYPPGITFKEPRHLQRASKVNMSAVVGEFVWHDTDRVKRCPYCN